MVGLPEMVAESIRACDTDTRRELWGSVVVCGGGSLLPGLTDRLHWRLNQLVPQMSMKVKLIAPTTPQERPHPHPHTRTRTLTAGPEPEPEPEPEPWPQPLP
jgi:actin-related protein